MPSTLAAGDIAIIGANSDDADGFAFVVLTDIEAGTQISFTDNGWITGATPGFRTGEGVFTYTFSGAVPAGTVINVTTVTGMNLAGGGDSIIAFQGTLASPTILFALDFADGNATFATTASDSNTSGVPTGLSVGTTAVAVGPDNVIYTGITSGTRAELLAAIGNSANWTGSDAVRQTFSTTPFTVGGASTFSIGDATVTEGDAGTTTLTFTITRTVGTGTASVTWTTADGTATAGADYTAATGTASFANGETSVTITVQVAGDTEIEGNETVLVNLSNPVGGAIADGQAVGTIQNDDEPEAPTPPFINEFHYDNAGNDAGEFVEIGGVAGTDLTGYSLVFYNGSNGVSYRTITLSGVIGNQQNGLGVLSFLNPANDIQNGAPDGIALVDADGEVVEFISYEGVLTATNGPASGMTSVDVGVFQPGNTTGDSISRVGVGGVGDNFTWALTTATAGTVNTGQTFSPTVSVSDASITEGDAGTTILSFTVTRSSGAGAASVDYSTADGPTTGGTGATGADYQSATGTISFVDGQTSQVVQIVVNGDTASELDETLTLNLSNPSVGLAIGDGVGVGTIVNDDAIPATISIDDVQIVEGDAGQTLAVFTVTRAGGAGAFSVDFATAAGSATAGVDYLSASGTLSFLAGENSQTISVVINGDTTGEPPETFTVTLSNAVDAIITDGQGVGTIVNDDLTRIFDLQGEGHTSPYVGQSVLTEGVVTAIDSNGFYIQDETGDGNARTSDAIFVFTGTAPAGIAIGDMVRVQGEVEEYQADPTHLSTTQIVDVLDYDVVGTGTVDSTVIGTGAGERAPPTQVIDDDGMTSYDPDSDGIDFYESMEGMLVTLSSARAVTNTDGGGTYVVVSEGAGATGVNDRGGITLIEGAPDDFNPEAILIYDDSTVSGAYAPDHTQGDRLGDVTGVVSYFGGEFEVIVTAPVTVVEDVELAGETTDLVEGDTAATGTADRLTVATYNVENLDPGDGARIDALAADIANNLGTPDIISLVEVQDGNDGTLSGQASAQALIDRIFALSGVMYEYVEVAPTVAGSTGGEPGGNIRNGFLYNPDRADFIEGSAEAIDGAAYTGSRRPLSVQFAFNGETVTLISMHSTSRGGSEPLFGDNQPPVNAGDASRLAQSQGVRDYIDALHTASPGADVIVLGDLNAFYFEQSVELLEGGSLDMSNLWRLLDPEDRYSYGFGANMQTLDHILVSDSLMNDIQFDAVHINSDLRPGAQASDHDALVTRLFVVGEGDNLVVGTLAGEVLAGLGGDDIYIVNHAGDEVEEQADAGHDTVRASVNHVLAANVEDLVLTGSATLGEGNTLNNAISGNALNNILEGQEGDDVLDGGDGNDVLNGGLGADQMIGGAGDDVFYLDGLLDQVFEAVDGGVDTVIARGNFTLAAGQDIETLRAAGGAGGLTLTGNEFANAVNGHAGDDVLSGGGGNDVLFGGAGADQMDGGQGDDLFYVDNALDQVIEAIGGGTDTILARVDYTLGAGQEIEVLRAAAGLTGLTLTGNALDNRISGGAGDDVLSGGGGADSISGGAGDDTVIIDTLSGRSVISLGAGEDVLQLASTGGAFGGGGVSTVNDFQTGAGGDVIDLGAWLSGGALSGFTGSDPFADGFLRLVQTGTGVRLQANRDGVGNDFVTLVTFRNATVAAFTAENFRFSTPDQAPVLSDKFDDAQTLPGLDGAADVFAPLAARLGGHADWLDGSLDGQASARLGIGIHHDWF